MLGRIVVAVALFAVLAGVAWYVERRRRPEAPSQSTLRLPEQIDRHDFPIPDAPWLVVLFTSKNCLSCAGLAEKAAPLASDDVAVAEVEYFTDRALHERYHIAAAPVTLVVNAEGVVRASFVGAFGAAELWEAVAALRS